MFGNQGAVSSRNGKPHHKGTVTTESQIHSAAKRRDSCNPNNVCHPK